MRASSVVKAELDTLNAQAVAIDAEINERRERLAGINAQRKALEIEFQGADAREAQAKLTGV